MMSLITIFRQHTILDFRRRSAAVLLCLAPVGCHEITWFLIPTTQQLQQKNGSVELPKLTLTPATAVLPLSNLPGQVLIPIASEYSQRRSLTPAVSYIKAYPTPAR